MPIANNKASSPLTIYRGKHEFGLANPVLTRLLTVSLLVLSGCTGFRVCRDGDQWFGQDKKKHFLASAVIAAGGTSIASTGTDEEDAALIGFSAAMGAGLGKEFYDLEVKKTCFSWKDLVWDFIGASVGATAGMIATE